MIPQSLKDILSNTDNAGLYQTIALILFLICFLALVVYVFSRPKKYYKEDAEIPLDDDQTTDLKN